MKRIISLATISSIFSWLFAASIAHAEEVKLLSGLPIIGDEAPGIVNLLNVLFTALLGGAAILAVLFIVIGGFEIMSRDSPFYISEGKDRIKHAVIGLLIILGSYLILNTINPDLVRLDIFQTLQSQGGVQTQPLIPITTTQGGVGGAGGAGNGPLSYADVNGRHVCVGGGVCPSNAITEAQCRSVQNCAPSTSAFSIFISCSCTLAVTSENTTPAPNANQNTNNGAPSNNNNNNTNTGNNPGNGQATIAIPPPPPAPPSLGTSAVADKCIEPNLLCSGVTADECSAAGCSVEVVSGGFDRCRC